ncbi:MULTISPECIES: hypothetical protein [Halomonadaceae]|uniref:Uncharacterized protein n=2 Tax=Vreelandella TaxID=3137766 RepID=A0A7Z0RZS0_9GAMM|nr:MULTISPECIES: hypothetical protein [Halomonas]AJY53093.1 hypothetical protein KO116_P100347 [Halomonas sp. KO116]NYS79128.1 hypothetical protein [Halomonas glaciei]|tara:strand:- start:2565 stop:2813 length:249 start_codon:yes stop_codon:yes gene_type:complete
MNDKDINAPINQFEGVPLNVLMFLNLRDGGGGPALRAEAAAEFYGITVAELKAECRKVGMDWIAQDGALIEINQRVYDWARS